MHRRSTTDAYLTVFFSLILSIVLSLILTLLWGVRISLTKLQAECVTETGIESVLAEFNRALFERYDLLFTDMSYGGPVADIGNTEERLRHYVQNNLEPTMAGTITGQAKMTGLQSTGVSIPEHVRAGDGNGAVLRKQILAYMTAEPLAKTLSEATQNLGVLQMRGYDTYDMEAEMDRNYAELQQALQQSEEGDTSLMKPVEEVQEKRSLGVLRLAHPAPASISRETIVPSDYASKRGLTHGNGTVNAGGFSAADALLFDEYLFEKCGFHGNVLDGSRLKYQLEYMIAGKPGDYANLDAVAKKLMFWREASNYLYILTDAEKTGLAQTIAGIVSLILLCPEAEEPLKHAILFAWSFAESVSDLKILFGGGKVPLVKSSETWKTSFSGMLGFGKGASGDTGLDYEGYLRMLVLMTDLQTKTMRLMDIMEMDIRETPGNLHFRIDGCIDSLTAACSFESRMGFSGTFTRHRGFTEWPKGETGGGT